MPSRLVTCQDGVRLAAVAASVLSPCRSIVSTVFSPRPTSACSLLLLLCCLLHDHSANNLPHLQDPQIVDNAETVYISSLALLKMLRHGRAGVPMEVMGLMLGEFIDDYTVRVVDVFAMPQSGTGVSVEAVDPVFQTKMMDMLRQTNRYNYNPLYVNELLLTLL